jgi:hypothetical protein
MLEDELGKCIRKDDNGRFVFVSRCQPGYLCGSRHEISDADETTWTILSRLGNDELIAIAIENDTISTDTICRRLWITDTDSDLESARTNVCSLDDSVLELSSL